MDSILKNLDTIRKCCQQTNALVTVTTDGIDVIYRCNVNPNKCETIHENMTIMSIPYAVCVHNIDARKCPLLKPENIPETQHQYFIF